MSRAVSVGGYMSGWGINFGTYVSLEEAAFILAEAYQESLSMQGIKGTVLNPIRRCMFSPSNNGHEGSWELKYAIKVRGQKGTYDIFELLFVNANKPFFYLRGLWPGDVDTADEPLSDTRRNLRRIWDEVNKAEQPPVEGQVSKKAAAPLLTYT